MKECIQETSCKVAQSWTRTRVSGLQSRAGPGSTWGASSVKEPWDSCSRARSTPAMPRDLGQVMWHLRFWWVPAGNGWAAQEWEFNEVTVCNSGDRAEGAPEARGAQLLQPPGVQRQSLQAVLEGYAGPIHSENFSSSRKGGNAICPRRVWGPGTRGTGELLKVPFSPLSLGFSANKTTTRRDWAGCLGQKRKVSEAYSTSLETQQSSSLSLCGFFCLFVF